MTSFTSNSLVQLSALLCLIPLALDNPSLQAHVATIALPAVVSALRAHRDHADVQAKGLVVLGVLGQVSFRHKSIGRGTLLPFDCGLAVKT